MHRMTNPPQETHSLNNLTTKSKKNIKASKLLAVTVTMSLLSLRFEVALITVGKKS